MTQSVMPLTPGLDSGHDLRVVRSSPLSGSALSTESAWDLAPHSLSDPSHAFSLSLK